MRPLRLVFEGFGSYRDNTDVQLSDVDFFVLTGPTGSGKSTVIDALCFALYGTVPRWGKKDAIRDALAPSVNECTVCLVFEASGGRYVAVRQLRRDARGKVHTKEARLDQLDASVPADAGLTKILEVAQPLAEGDKVTGAVSELLGIGYEQFTQCVVLPQGRFAEFLQAKPGDRQDLLIQLLAYAVYEDVGQRARERAKVALGKLDMAEKRLAELGTVTDEVVAAAEKKVADLDALVPTVDSAVEEMADLRVRWTEANAAATAAQEQLADLDALRRPGDVADLAEGQSCPVCRQQVHDLPHHEMPADLDDARVAVTSAKSRVTALRKAQADASRAAAAARADVASAEKQAEELAGELRDAPSAAEVHAAVVRREAADTAAERARAAAKMARTAVERAQRDRTALGDEEQRAWSALRESRDRFVALGVPPVDGTDLATAWRGLLTWAQTRRAELSGRSAELARAEQDLRARGSTARAELTALLERHGVPLGREAKPDVVLESHRVAAARDLAELVARRSKSAALAAEVARCHEEEQVARMLGNLLKSNGFEAWLCAEALESLVTEASEILLQLSGGQYELARDARNDLVVLDHNDAGTTRPVNTLSGGETFQASLA
ncbi:MAG: AAA family ATPase, partial [Pseudonocardiaceae bacterium]|nr:AAA family ATPase [Pseudonocardiaceae bacterium]